MFGVKDPIFANLSIRPASDATNFMNRTLRTTIIGLMTMLGFQQATGANLKQQLTNDVTIIADLVLPDERSYVTNYLYKGPSLRADVVTAGMARSALNRINGNPKVTLPLARTLYRHVADTNFPSETRYYGLARMIDLAQLNKEVEGMTRSVANEIVKHEQGQPRNLAERYLQGKYQGTAPLPPSNYTASQFVGHWRLVDTKHKLVTDITFKADGTYTGILTDNGRPSWSFAGRWMLKDGNLHYEYTASSDKSIPVGSKDADWIVEVTKNRYVIENSLGREAYVRME